jgi:hypothetical protein
MYKIEITAETLAELSGKVLSLASKLMTGTAAEGWSTSKATADVVAEVAKAAPVDPTPAPKSALVAEVSESQPTTTEPSSTPADVEELEVVDLPLAEVPAIDFNRDIRTLALDLVSKRGKPALEKILADFGVVKASHLEPARLPDLHVALREAMGK